MGDRKISSSAYELYQRIQVLLAAAEFGQSGEINLVSSDFKAKTKVIQENKEQLEALSEDLSKLNKVRVERLTTGDPTLRTLLSRESELIKEQIEQKLNILFTNSNSALYEQLNTNGVFDAYRETYLSDIPETISIRAYAHMQGENSGLTLSNNEAIEYIGAMRHVKPLEEAQQLLEQVPEYNHWVEVIKEQHDNPFVLFGMDDTSKLDYQSRHLTRQNNTESVIIINTKQVGSVGFEADSQINSENPIMLRERGSVFESYEHSLVGLIAHETFHAFQYASFIENERGNNPQLKPADVQFKMLLLPSKGKVSEEKLNSIRKLAVENLDKVYYYTAAYFGGPIQSGSGLTDEDAIVDASQRLQGIDNVRFVASSTIEQQATLAQNRILECLCDLNLIQEYHQRGDYYDVLAQEDIKTLERQKERPIQLDEIYNHIINEVTDPDDKSFIEEMYQEIVELREALHVGKLSDIDAIIKQRDQILISYQTKLDQKNRRVEIPGDFFAEILNVYQLAERYKNSIDLQIEGEDIKQSDFINLDVDELRHIPPTTHKEGILKR